MFTFQRYSTHMQGHILGTSLPSLNSLFSSLLSSHLSLLTWCRSVEVFELFALKDSESVVNTTAHVVSLWNTLIVKLISDTRLCNMFITQGLFGSHKQTCVCGEECKEIYQDCKWWYIYFLFFVQMHPCALKWFCLKQKCRKGDIFCPNRPNQGARCDWNHSKP